MSLLYTEDVNDHATIEIIPDTRPNVNAWRIWNTRQQRLLGAKSSLRVARAFAEHHAHSLGSDCQIYER